MASNAENVSKWWRHYGILEKYMALFLTSSLVVHHLILVLIIPEIPLIVCLVHTFSVLWFWLWVDAELFNPYLSGLLNSLRPRQNCRHFAGDIFKCIFLSENAWISLKISLKFVPEVRISNIPVLVQIMARCWPGGKLLSEPMMVSLLTHICVTRSQWVNHRKYAISKVLGKRLRRI